jgi:hypothetical protein
MESLALQLDGQPAASSTFRRKRAVFKHALGYPVELGDLVANPLDSGKTFDDRGSTAAAGPTALADLEAENDR